MAYLKIFDILNGYHLLDPILKVLDNLLILNKNDNYNKVYINIILIICI